MPAVWLKCQDEEIFLTGPPRPDLVVSDLSSLSKPDKSHRTQKYIDSVNLDWTRNSQWEREKPLKTAPDVCEGQGSLYTFRVLLWSHRERNELRECLCALKLRPKGPRKSSDEMHIW